MRSRMRIAITSSAIPLLAIALLQACRGERVYHHSRIQLGTVINLSIVAQSEGEASRLARGVFTQIREVEEKMSPYLESSDVFRINHLAWKGPVRISDETISIINKSVEISSETDGCFDITFASLSPLWNFNKKPFHPPNQSSINRYLQYVNYRYIMIDYREKSIRLLRKKTKIGLGGIAKGYAIKRGIEYLKKHGVKAAIVEAGGDLQVIGDKFGQHWRTGLLHPRKKNIVMAISMNDGDSITTSGDYERYAMYRSMRYHHIINPRTGYPTKTFSSVSVIAQDPVLADAYATALFIMGKDRAIKFIRGRGGISAILIDLQMNLYASRELRNRITPLEEITIHWF
jgi:thiamine biosynthesis lipoprotein